MKKLFFMLMLFVFFTGISFAGIVTVDTTDLINDPQHDKILPKIDANFTDLDDTKLDSSGTAGVAPSVIDITSQSMLYGDNAIGSEVALTADTFPGVDDGSVQAISGNGTYTGIASGVLDVDLIPFVYQYYIEDLTTAITTGTKKYVIRAPHAMTVTSVRGSANFAATGGPGIIIDINEDNTTILSTKLYIDSTEKTSTTAGSTAVISDASIADDAEITIDFDQVGSTVSGSGLVITIAGTRAI